MGVVTTSVFVALAVVLFVVAILPESSKGPFINYVDEQGPGGLVKWQRYNISLCSKFVNEGGGVKNPRNHVDVVYEWSLIIRLILNSWLIFYWYFEYLEY